MKHSATLWQNVKAELKLLLLINILEVEVHLGVDHVHDSPIEPSKGQFDIETGQLTVPRLGVVNSINLL